jgi:hypothetical protein
LKIVIRKNKVMDVKGKVIDNSNNEPMFNANVYVSDKNGKVLSGSPSHGSATDFDGKFKLSGVPTDGVYVTASSVGFGKKTEFLNPSAQIRSMNLNFRLSPTTEQLPEFTVVAEKDEPTQILAREDKKRNWTPYIIGGVSLLVLIGGYFTYKKLKG